jgi:hypothetical protein
MRHFARRGAFALLVFAGALAAVTCAAADPGVSTTTPFTYGGTNFCTGEPFSGTGTLHTTMTEGVSTSGNIESHAYFRIDGLKAVGALTGKTYVVQDVFADDFTFSKASEETFAIVAHYVRVGEDGTLVLGDDFYEYLRTHITANANGMITASKVDMSSQPCQ